MGTNMIIGGCIGSTPLSSNVNQYPSVLEDGNTVAWYDYTAASTITKDGSNFVSRWNDRLGSGHDLIQAVGTNQPLLTADGVLFDGVDNWMKTAAFTLNQPEFIYLVVNQKSFFATDAIIDGNVINTAKVTQRVTSPNVSVFAGTAHDCITTTAINQYGILRILVDGANSKIIWNEGTPSTGNPGSANMGGITMCADGSNIAAFANVELKEAIFRKVADNTTDETAIYNYLKNKHGL